MQLSTDATRIRSLEAKLSEAIATIEQLQATESAVLAAENDCLKHMVAKESRVE